jgi:hypothetical protein
MRVFFLFLVMSAMAFCDTPSQPSPEQVQEGDLWTAKVRVDVPQAAFPALQAYLTTLIYSRPLPWPYYLEKASVANEIITVQGRLLRPGTYALPLGVFVWQGSSYILPSLSFTSNPIKIPLLSASDMLLPFPNVALVQTTETKKQQQELLQQNQEMGYTILLWQERLRHTLAILGLLLTCSPFAFQLWRWWKLKKPSAPPKPVPTIAEEFQEIKTLSREGQTPWEQLVLILNRAASTTSLTTFELEQRFSSEGSPGLAKAAESIETQGYRPNNDQYFTQTVRLVETGLQEKQLIS